MRRDVFTLFVLTAALLAGSVLAPPAMADDTPLAFRATSDAPVPGTMDDAEVARVIRRGMTSDGVVLALAGPTPERGFDDESGEVYTVGLTDDERAYLRKSPQEAFLRSAVLPGWGQRYGERNVRGAIFTAVEVGLWTGMLLTRQEWLEGEDDYMTFARQHAGVTGQPDHQYYVDIGNYNNTVEFNDAQRQQRQYADQYKNPSDYWEWDTSANRERFEDIRIDADAAERRIYYFLGGMVLNRIVAAIDASRGLSSRQDDLREKEAGFSFALGVNRTTRGPELSVRW